MHAVVRPRWLEICSLASRGPAQLNRKGAARWGLVSLLVQCLTLRPPFSLLRPAPCLHRDEAVHIATLLRGRVSQLEQQIHQIMATVVALNEEV